MVVNYHLNKREFSKVILESEKVIAELGRKKYHATQLIMQFVYYQMFAFAELRDHHNCQLLYHTYIKEFETGTVRWYNVKELMFLLNMNQSKYRNALEIYAEVCTDKNFKYQARKRHESWNLFSAYLVFLRRINIIEDKIDNDDFRIQKFLNEVPLFTSDKVGHNIPIIIIQLIFMILQKKYSDLSSKHESIEKYSARYLTERNNIRPYHFIKMLLLVPKFNFDQKLIQTKAVQHLEKLQSDSSEANQPLEIEIIPYETLWKYVLESLEN